MEPTVRNNGYRSEVFTLSSSKRQWCPFLPSFFTLTLEQISQRIQHNNGVEDIKILDILDRISLYAVDVILFLSNPYESLGGSSQRIKKFEEVSLKNYNQRKFKIQCIKLSTTIYETILNMDSFWTKHSVGHFWVQLLHNTDSHMISFLLRYIGLLTLNSITI